MEPTLNLGIDRSSSVIEKCVLDRKKPRNLSDYEAFLLGAGAGFEPTTSGL